LIIIYQRIGILQSFLANKENNQCFFVFFSHFGCKKVINDVYF